MKILIAAGGTGGHLFPAQQLADMLKDEATILFVGHRIGLSPFFTKEGIAFAEISAHPLKKGFFTAVWKGFWQAMKLLWSFSPDVVVGFGSYHTFPALLAAVLLHKRLVLFEANSQLGRVNRFFAWAAARVAFQFPPPLKRGVWVPWLPWKERKEVLSIEDARIQYGLNPSRKTILIFGGSQGAAFLNEIAPSVIAKLQETFQVIHLTGQATSLPLAYKKLGIDAFVKPFESEMSCAYRAADLALCRSGAGTIAELIQFELPALLIPYPFATGNHQKKNGEVLADQWGGARLVVQNEASVERLVQELEALDKEREERKNRLRILNLHQKNRVHLAEIVREVAS